MTLSIVTTMPGCGASGTTFTDQLNWDIAGRLPLINGSQPGVAGACIGMHNQVLLVAGGANFPDSMPWLGGKKHYQQQVYVFRKDNDGKLTPVQKSITLPFPIAYAANCSTAYGVVCAGGENEQGIRKEVFLLQWDSASENLRVTGLPSLPFAVTNAAITSSGHSLFLAGGEKPGEVSDSFLTLDLEHREAGWKSLATLPAPVSHTVLVSQSQDSEQNIYLIGGRKKNESDTSTLYAEVYQYHVMENKWTAKHALPYALSAGTGVAFDEEHILLFGGDRGETFHKTEALIAAIALEHDLKKKAELVEQKNKLQSTHPGFSKLVLAYNTRNDNWQRIDSIPFEVPVTTTVVNWENEIIIASGEIKAGVRTPDILSAHGKQ